MQKLIKKHAEKIRFGAVGLVNTAIDFVILFALVMLGLPSIASNFISTACAQVFSFFANKKFAFRDEGKNTTKKIVYFFAITMFGLWVIQPIIIEGVRLMFGTWFGDICFVKLIAEFFGPWFKASNLVLLVGKLLATVASLTWNYLLYRKFVFNKRS